MPRPRSKDRDVYFNFYPTDWRGDEKLPLCSLAARGLWVEMMCLAHFEQGFVLVNGAPPDDATLAKAVRSTTREVQRLKLELLEQGVCSQTAEGVIYSRRMVRDARRRLASRENGRLGGSPRLIELDEQDNPNKPTGYPNGSAQDKPQIQHQHQHQKTPDDDGEAVLVFPTVGTRSSWPLTQAQLDEWAALFPGVQPLDEARHALAWIKANPSRRKTFDGMPRFFVHWLGKAQNDASRRQNSRPKPAYRPAPLPAYDMAWDEECRRLHGGVCLSRKDHEHRVDMDARKVSAS